MAKHLDANVCSIYLFDQGDEKLTLRATQGLNPELVGKVTLKLGEGLTGIALQELRSINVRESSKQPGYKFVPGLFEERFDAFCAGPHHARYPTDRRFGRSTGTHGTIFGK